MCEALVTRSRSKPAEEAFLSTLQRWAGKFSPWVAEEAPAPEPLPQPGEESSAEQERLAELKERLPQKQLFQPPRQSERFALAEAEEERRRARAERRTAAAEARRQAEIALAAIEAEIAEMRGSLQRETLTEERLDEAMARIDARLGVLPSVEGTPEPEPARPRWKVGDRAVASSGWITFEWKSM